MIYGISSIAPLAWAVFGVLLSYPLLFGFLRYIKHVPLRFNVTVFVAVVATGLLPMELAGYEANRSASQLHTLTSVLQAEQRLRDMMLLCDVDPMKVRPDRIEAAARRIADETTTWFNAKDMKEISTAEWLKLDTKCVGWVARNKTEYNRTDMQLAGKSLVWWLAAAITTGTVGLIAVYLLMVGRMRQDLRDVQVKERVELNGPWEVLLALLVCGYAFLPFTLLWLHLFKYSARAQGPKNST
ncbi:TPA: hypothetical protein QDB23_006622 [Burkholderia vietnamiensis]|nr:hypothetical protein [Burkholderia vietnamiensis]